MVIMTEFTDKKIEFQLYDWVEDYEEINVNSDNENTNNEKYIIHAFGRCLNGKSVYAKITGYYPDFYILIPKELQNNSDLALNDFLKKIEFSLKNKDNKKIYYKYKNSLKAIKLIRIKRAEGFRNDKKYFFAHLIFNNIEGLKKYRYYLENNKVFINGISYAFKLYESNLPPMLRCFHIRDISGCSWVEVSKYKLISNEDDKESRCDIEINVCWKDLISVKKDYNAPLKICSFDIECTSIDGEFPQAKRPGDKIIQIGATTTILGTSIPYRQYIACLNDTEPLNDIIVESFNTEHALIHGFINEIINNDCDIITGYNIFFFDEKYIYDRCKEILKIDVSYMSKLKNYNCKFLEFKLASMALGENILKLWHTPGRVHIDLMKDIQKTFSLTSYKLDYVASHFIKGEIKFINYLENRDIELHCQTIQDITIGDYIHIEITKGFISDEIGDKYLVKDIKKDESVIIVQRNINSSDLEKMDIQEKVKLFWSQAKDDVGPKDIFRLQKGTSKDRSIIAKYCIKDCKLVNLLINKLEVVTKNMEMANVCYVPLSFLFVRGQGIKLFSLCLKEYRKQKYIFPVIKPERLYQCNDCNNQYFNSPECPTCRSRKREEIETESTSYEGAIVFEPLPKVEYEALATKDYMSLYPSSIMQKNMSHETIIEDEIYDNLPNIKYYNAQYKDTDGTIQYRRFAQVENKLGVIPSILDNLLKERKLVKKKMEQETDPFKYKILDAKQFAIKITANSLYGQLGAPKSPICKRDIAACTTSTGREMLILAKKYDEEILPVIINSLKYYYHKNDYENINRIYDLELKNKNYIDNIKDFIDTIKNITLQPVVRYGDSVVGKTPLLLRNSQTKQIITTTIDKLSPKHNYKYCHESDKEFSDINDIETWTEKGWTKIIRVIRHKLAKTKKLYRVTTCSGSVIVTDDHSLLTADGKIIQPQQLDNHQKLLHSFPPIKNFSTNIKLSKIANISDELEALNYYCYLKALGKNVSLNYIDNQYIISLSKDTDYSLISIIQHQADNHEYVYDLTTTNHHFHAGVGSLIVHNTDSIFSCYRFRENLKPVFDDTLPIWKNIVNFGYQLLAPLMSPFDRKIFYNSFQTYYSDDKIIDLKLPVNHNENHTDTLLNEKIIVSLEAEPLTIGSAPSALIVPLKDRMKSFIKEYMEENYIPWLITLAELVETGNMYMFDIKLLNWAEYLLSKIKLQPENLVENRKLYLSKPILDELNIMFENNLYSIPSNDSFNQFINKFIPDKENCFPFAKEIKLDFKKLNSVCKAFIEKSIKEKWICSDYNKEVNKIIKDYLKSIIVNDCKYEDVIYHVKITMKEKLNIDITILAELLISNLKKEKEIILNDDIDLYSITKTFIEKYNKHNGTKTLEQIVDIFIEKDLELNYDSDKTQHYTTVINFINDNMKYLIQPRWQFDDNQKELWIDFYEGGNSIIDKRTLEYTMELGKLSGELIKSKLPYPHNCEYEKTFWPFAILTKKRYVGNKYEYDVNKFKQDFMGIVLKRRDNAPIVKEICGGIIDYLINHKDPESAKNYTKKCLQDMFDNKYDIKYFIQSRTLKLKESYKDWTKIAHVYLANKIMERDPGNTPQSGDRIEYVVIKVESINKKEKLLQSDIIETPKYIIENNLDINYLFYLTNQIMNPALQFLELVDKNAIDIFKEFIDKYSIPKEKIIKKIKIENNNPNEALDILLKIKGKKSESLKTTITKLIKEIKKTRLIKIKDMTPKIVKCFEKCDQKLKSYCSFS